MMHINSKTYNEIKKSAGVATYKVVTPHLNCLVKTISCDPHLNCLVKTVQMRGHNICFMQNE